MSESLKTRALAAHQAAVRASEIQRINEQAAAEAKHALGLVQAWAEWGVLVCARELVYGEFVRDGYRFGWEGGIDNGIRTVVMDPTTNRHRIFSLEDLGDTLLRIDAMRQEHARTVASWSPENRDRHRSEDDCRSCTMVACEVLE